ncbi:MAG: UpxY family transcription antiterminator [Sedimentisphaerales bacterium]|nr:UpxY family transcription antiterminator [Sedimentisphaerales bacterium]
MLKPDENPPILYPEQSQLAQINGCWWVAHTKARNEKVLAWQLLKWNIAYFLPMREKVRVRKGRRHRPILPLFSGYVFFCGDEDARYKALTTNRIANVIEVKDQVLLVRELEQINQALQSKTKLDPYPFLKKGDLCRVTAGPLVGMEGIMVRKRNNAKLVLNVAILGQAAAMEIDADLLEPL